MITASRLPATQRMERMSMTMQVEGERHEWIVKLQDPDKNVRLKAVLALGESADTSTLDALLARLGTEPDFFVGDNLIWAIVRMGDAAVLPVIALLGDPSAEVRFRAAHTLSKLADARAVDGLLTALDDADVSVGQKAIYALGRIADPSALPGLVAKLGGGSRENRATLQDALAAFGDAAVQPLTAMLKSADANVRVDVTEILGSIGGSAVSDGLATALSDVDWQVRFAAVNALRGVVDPAVRPALVGASRDEHPHVRVLAMRLLEESPQGGG
jgi:HEAT repeat protein